mmetsp:Transcript_6010/g.7292  ORF Transcript_6010/g.7292 Transcript_6010/m.7292 type:complete len:303 (+) Transcript_6010:122-1030(+)
MDGEGETSLVVVVVDFNEKAWVERSERLGKENGLKEDENNKRLENSLTLPEIIDSVQAFLQSVLLLNRDNDVAVYAAFPDGSCRLLYPDFRSQTKIIETGQIHYKVSKRLKLAVRASGELLVGNYEYKSSLAASLSCAICYCNRLKEKYEKAAHGTQSLVPRSRILLLNVSEEDPTQYIATLNTAFAAQKLGIPIDVCDFSSKGSSLLQQLAHLTGSLLVRSTSENSSAALTQLLWTVFLPDLNSRKQLKLPDQPPMIMEAACFCHKKMINRGYVCSVCLSVFCEPSLKCATCGNRVRISTK